MKKSILFMLMISLLTQCQKEETKSTQGKLDILTAGYVSKNGDTSPAYWKNGKEVVLTSGNGFAYAVRVVNGNVYVGGNEAVNGFHVARIWKDGVVAATLSDGTSNVVVTDFIITGNDTHVVGIEDTRDSNGNNGTIKAIYWKNGISTTLSENGATMCVFSKGSDIYACGLEYAPEDKSTAVYWKNGQRTLLPGDDALVNYGSIYGDDIYFVGHRLQGGKYIATYWKNGVATNLTDGLHRSDAYGIVIKNGDVYIAGWEQNENNYDVACYWKNGKKVTLSDGSIYEDGGSIGVSNAGDVYTTSYSGNGSTIWKNGSNFATEHQWVFGRIIVVE